MDGWSDTTTGVWWQRNGNQALPCSAGRPPPQCNQQQKKHPWHTSWSSSSHRRRPARIGGYLGDGYVVESSIGHIRDLPQSAADTPAKIKDKPWGRLAVDVENGFEPYYVVPRDKKAHISKLKSLLKDADELYLATDEDREGEAIAWHLLDELKPKGIPVHRMVFHEITKAAILEAVANPRQINDDLVEAQEARRILDRLYGYEVSPVLWKKVMSGLSAGRVQSVATRLVVDRERERIEFRVASYWDLEGTFDAGAGHEPADVPRAGSTPSTGAGSPAAPTSAPTASSPARSRASCTSTAAGPRRWSTALRDTSYDVRSVEAKPYSARRTRRSAPRPSSRRPSRKLGMSASVTMSVAQRLYENGYITYMRTDSTTLSGGRGRRGAVAGARALRRRVPPRRAAGLRVARSRTPRRRTRRSGPPATRSGRRRRPG